MECECQRNKCLCYLKSQNTDVAFVQEIRLIDKEAYKETYKKLC